MYSLGKEIGRLWIESYVREFDPAFDGESDPSRSDDWQFEQVLCLAVLVVRTVVADHVRHGIYGENRIYRSGFSANVSIRDPRSCETPRILGESWRDVMN